MKSDDAKNTLWRIGCRVLDLPGLRPSDRVILMVVAQLVADDPTLPIPVTRTELARLAGIGRQTFYDRLTGLLERGLLQERGVGLLLGESLLVAGGRHGSGGADFLRR